MQYVTRAEWGAQPPKEPLNPMPTAGGVKVHWIGGEYTTPADHAQCAAEVRSIQQEHMSDPVQGWIDIAYNLLICQHGPVFEGRGPGIESGANGDQPLNHADYAVCAIVGTHEPMTPELLNGIGDAINLLRANGAGPEVLGHRDGYNTDCPGDALYALVHSGRWAAQQDPAPAPQPAPTPPPVAVPAWPGRYLQLASPMMHGDDVGDVQQRLTDRGWTVPGGVDRWYGDGTAGIVGQFQQDSCDNGWPLTVDRICGPKTWDALFRRPIS